MAWKLVETSCDNSIWPVCDRLYQIQESGTNKAL